MTVYCLQGSMIGRKESNGPRGGGISEGICFTLNTIDRHCVMEYLAIENHPNDSRVKIRDDNICQTLSSRCGTGGGNVPMVLAIDCHQQDSRFRVRGDGQVNQTLGSNMCNDALNGGAILEGVGIERNDKATTLDASYYKGAGSRGNKERTAVEMIGRVRRFDTDRMRKAPGS